MYVNAIIPLSREVPHTLLVFEVVPLSFFEGRAPY